jgi:hypothetical protein
MIHVLPLDVMCHVFSFLPARQLLSNIAPVCTQWKGWVESGAAASSSLLVDLSLPSRFDVAPSEEPSAAQVASLLRGGGAFSNVRELRLGNHCALSDEALIGVGELQNLRTFLLDHCHGIGDRTLQRLPPQLAELSLFGSGRLPNVTDTGLASLARLPLRTLKLDACALHLSNAGIAALAPLGNTLTFLVLAGCCGWSACFLDARTLQLVATQFSGLTSLSLGSTGAKDRSAAGLRRFQAGFAQLRHLTHLEYLNCMETELTDVGLRGIAQISNLRFLCLSKHSLEHPSFITNEGIRLLATGLPHLEELELDACIPSDGYGTTWDDASRLTDDALGFLLPLAEHGSLQLVRIDGNVGMFAPGTLDFLRNDPDQLRTSTLFEGLAGEQPPRADRAQVVTFWTQDHRPTGVNASRLLDMGILQLCEDHDPLGRGGHLSSPGPAAPSLA